MPVSTSFNDTDLMVKVVLPNAKLRHTLEAQSDDGHNIDTGQFLIVPSAIQSNTSAIHIRRRAPSAFAGAGAPRLPEILHTCADRLLSGARSTEVVSWVGWRAPTLNNTSPSPTCEADDSTNCA